MHDAGKLLNPLIADGQVHGAFVQGIAAALYEEFVYDANGSFLSGTFADYLVPTVTEIPKLEILHQETPSPLTPLGAKGLAEGNCMSTPACIANAVADALGVKDISLPLTPRRLHALIAGAEPPRPAGTGKAELPTQAPADGRTMRGSGFVEVAAPPAMVWRALLDPESLKAVIPGCHELRKTGDNDYVADVSLGVGPVRGRFTATVGLSDLVTETSGRIGGTLAGPLGSASGSGMLRLSPAAAGTRIDYDYAVAIGGKVAAVGGRLLDGATQVIIRQFFERLGRRLAAPAAGSGASGTAKPSLWRRLFGRAEAP
jgi:2-furoyl-CoA dehydrogenase large subunit